MKNNFPEGVWPVMLTPFTQEDEVDYRALEELVQWYIQGNVSGLFAVCQSSEMFKLSLEERIKIAKTVVKTVKGRIPVVASGHISETMEEQAEELNAMADTGVGAIILISNRLAREEEADSVWLERCKSLLKRVNMEIPLGLYECPYPYKRVLSTDIIKWCISTGRFFFLKDTCCDIAQIRQRLELIQGTNLLLYNANTTTLLDSLQLGASGYCGVMANFHPELYVWLCDNYQKKEAEELSNLLMAASFIEKQYYPVNAKYHLSNIEGLKITTHSRVQEESGLTATFQQELHMLDSMIRGYKSRYGKYKK